MPWIAETADGFSQDQLMALVQQAVVEAKLSAPLCRAQAGALVASGPDSDALGGRPGHRDVLQGALA